MQLLWHNTTKKLLLGLQKCYIDATFKHNYIFLSVHFIFILWDMNGKGCQQATSSVHYTTSCKHSLVLLRMGEIIAQNMLS